MGFAHGESVKEKKRDDGCEESSKLRYIYILSRKTKMSLYFRANGSEFQSLFYIPERSLLCHRA